MSIFKENEWETDETGDKLTKELFLSKKNDKSVKKKLGTKSRIGEKLKANGKKKSKILSTQDDSKGTDESAPRNKTDNKKRKSSTIEIDETIIKKWKSESIGQAAQKQGAKSSKKDFDKKGTKVPDRSNADLDKNTVGNEAVMSKRKNSDSKKKSDKLDGKKKSNGSHSEADSQTENLMTKSKKRRLKLKQKLSNGQKSTTSNESILTTERNGGEKDSSHSDTFSGDKYSTDSGVSNKMNESKLKIDRLQKLLIDKQKSTPKDRGNSTEPKSLRDRMLARLKSSRFRYLNEQMYNSESWSSKKYFKEDPDAFVAYHEGYKLQVDQWPLNPLDTIIASIKRLPKDYVVADFGCGEARLAESVPQKVHSLDLVAINDKVTACDMAHTSLLTGRIDVVVFCLSLMGTNLTDYLIEANRVLRKDGILKIAEVESRFEDVEDFVKNLASYGFVNTWKDLSHNLFYFMDFKKEGDISKKRSKLPPLALKSCLYKKR